MPDPPGTSCCDIVVVAASAGGVEALITLVDQLPENLSASVFVLLHVSETEPSLLPTILSRRSRLPVEPASDSAEVAPGRVYVAVPGRHLALEPGRMCLLSGPRENGHRPSADVLFRTAALAYGPRVVGIVLSGADADGAAGLAAIKRAGGQAMVQDPQEALHPRMPKSALQAVAVDQCLSARQLAAEITRLAQARYGPEHGRAVEPVMTKTPKEANNGNRQTAEHDYREGTPAVYTCPECHGTLWEVDEGQVVGFRCRVGHAYTAEHLLSGQSQNVEAALWTALRTLDERAQLSDNMAKRASKRGLRHAAQRFEEMRHEAQEAAGTLRQLLIAGEPGVLSKEDAAAPSNLVLQG